METTTVPLSRSDLERSTKRAAEALIGARTVSSWEGRLASSPLATAVAAVALSNGELSVQKRNLVFEYLGRTQNVDGGWGDTEISRSNLAASLLVLAANALFDQLSREQRERAELYVQKLGGLGEGLRRVYGSDLTFQVPIRMAAAYAKLLPWNQVDALPFELALAPRMMMGMLRLPVVSYALPALVCVGLSRHAKAPSWNLPVRWWRNSKTDQALALVQKMQPESGGYLEAIPITAFCLIGLKAADRARHPIATKATKFLLESQREDGSWPVEINLSVWNTTRAIDALAEAGLLESMMSKTDRIKTRAWLLARQTTGVSVYSDARSGGWGWNHLPGSVPDADDTAGAIVALKHLGDADDTTAITIGRNWLLRLQNRNGGWPTFCRGWEKLPFDRSAPDLTAHVLRAIGSLPSVKKEVERGWVYLEKNQRPDGSFAPLWFGCEAARDQLNATYGTAQVLLACRDNPERSASIKRKAIAWLLSIQNSDGSFGGCIDAPGTAEETGLAIRALAAHGFHFEDEQMMRAAAWLIERQRPDGSWNPAPIGFYFAVLWYYEELYPLYYALGGLGALARQKSDAPAIASATQGARSP